MFRMIGAMLLGGAAAFAPHAVAAQSWQPTKPITIVIRSHRARASTWWREWSAKG
jgi:hypothetical protein